MNTILKAGILLGLLCAAWTFFMGFTGWYKSPALMLAFFLVIPIQIGVLVWALRKTAAEGRRYWGQVGAGVLISFVGGLIIIGSSILFTAVVFPDYFTELQRIQAELLKAAGQTEAEVQAAVESAAAGMTSMAYALQGFIGTMVTGLVVSLVTAIFVRAR